ncbi:MAG: hypothetical protein ABJC87_17085 [Roseobacter sp.]
MVSFSSKQGLRFEAKTRHEADATRVGPGADLIEQINPVVATFKGGYALTKQGKSRAALDMALFWKVFGDAASVVLTRPSQLHCWLCSSGLLRFSQS